MTDHGTEEMRTKRLLLRGYRMDDAVILCRKLGSDPAMYEYSGWYPYQTEDMALETVKDLLADRDNYSWVIEHDGDPVGTIGAYDHDKDESVIEVGISIERGSWGKGYATEALSCVLKFLTEQEGIGKVIAWCAGENIGSIRAMEKAGMRFTHLEENSLEVDGKVYDRMFFVYEAK